MKTAYLQDIPATTHGTIAFTLDRRQFEFDTEMVCAIDGRALLKPIYVQNHLLNFADKKMTFQITFIIENEKPIMWTVSQIKCVRDSAGTAYYVISSPTPGLRIERRDNFRQYVGRECVLSLAENNQKLDGVVRDISLGGIGLLMYGSTSKEDALAMRGKEIYFDFEDPYFNYKISLSATVKNARTTERGIILGCKFRHEEERLQRYINMKQRADIAKHVDLLQGRRILASLEKETKLRMCVS